MERSQRFGPSLSEATRPQDVRMDHEAAKKTQRLLKKVSTLPGEERLSTEEAASGLMAIWNRVDEKTELEKLKIPGIPRALDPESLFEYDVSWTVSLVREGISVFAQFADETPEELLETAAEVARWEVRRTKRRVNEVERDPRDMSRERLLPDETTLQKIARYEAHLSRGLYQALHELEALQIKRSGGVGPLARLDVQRLEG